MLIDKKCPDYCPGGKNHLLKEGYLPTSIFCVVVGLEPVWFWAFFGVNGCFTVSAEIEALSRTVFILYAIYYDVVDGHWHIGATWVVSWHCVPDSNSKINFDFSA